MRQLPPEGRKRRGAPREWFRTVRRLVALAAIALAVVIAVRVGEDVTSLGQSQAHAQASVALPASSSTARQLVSREAAESALTRKAARGPVHSAAFSPNGKLVVTANEDGTARVWDVASGRSLQTLEGHTGPLFGAAFSPDGKLVVTASIDKTARVWDVDTGRSLHTLTGHTGFLLGAVFCPNGKLVVTASEDGTARIWDVASGRSLRTLS